MTSEPETRDDFDRDSWERRWSHALSKGAHAVDARPPNAHLLAEVADLRPGRALDAGAGHGAETLWLALREWQVAAVDFSATALDHARPLAEVAGADVAARIEYDFVACLHVHVHVAGSVPAMVQQLASGVAIGGTVLLVGHQPIDPATGEPTPAAGQVQVSVEPPSPRSRPTAGRSSSPKTVRARWPAAASTRWCALDGTHDRGRAEYG